MYDRAAEELDKIADPEFDRKEAKAVEEKLKQIAKEAGELGLGRISEAPGDIAEGVKGNKGKFQNGTRALAKAAKATAAARRSTTSLPLSSTS